MLPCPHGAQVPQGVLLHGAQLLPHWVGQALQQVAHGAQVWQVWQAVWQGAQVLQAGRQVLHWLIWKVWQWLWQLARRKQHSSSSSARTCGARTASRAANAEAVNSRCNMVSLLVGSVSDQRGKTPERPFRALMIQPLSVRSYSCRRQLALHRGTPGKALSIAANLRIQ